MRRQQPLAAHFAFHSQLFGDCSRRNAEFVGAPVELNCK
jgi:hypothetical protein